jgi:hypothetical protein
MLKLTTKNAALVALLMAGSAAVTLVPPAAHAQDNHAQDNNNGYRDDARTHPDRYNAHRYHRYHSSAYHRDWIGVGTPGYGVGFYTNRYHHYCNRWDPHYGYCTF